MTSRPIAADVVDYFLGLIPEVPDARERIHLLSPDDGSLRPLASKLLDRPELVAQIAELAGDGDRAFIMPFSVRAPECDLALALDVPIYGIDNRFERYGTKTGSRRLFESAGVPHPRAWTSSSPAATRVGSRSRSRSTCARAARRIPTAPCGC